MKTIPPEASRNSVRVPDGTYRTVPSAQEVGSYLELRDRIFPDGTSRLSVSARGLWTICLNGVFFLQWSKTLLARLADKPGASFPRGGRGGDIFIDAAEIPTAIGNSSSKRSRAVIAIVDARRVEDAVKSGVRSEMLAISAMTSEPSRARIQQRLDPESVRQASSSHRASGGRQSDEGSTDEPESTAGDLTLLVPIVEREVSGRMTPSVNARDIYSFLGGGRGFSHWFRDEAARAALARGDSYEDVSLSPPGSSGAGRPRKDYVLTLDAAKEIVRIIPGRRGRRIWTYLVESERRAYDAVIPVPPDEGGKEIRMEDGSVRLVLARSAMVACLAISERPFAGGVPVLSFSLRGLWDCTQTRRLFPAWSERVTSSLLQGTDYVLSRRNGAEPEVLVDVDVAFRAFGPLLGGVVKAAFDLIMDAARNARRARDEARALVEAREAMKSDMRAVARMSAGPDRARRLSDILGIDPGSPDGAFLGLHGMDVDEADDGSAGMQPIDAARFVPVESREMGGQVALSVIARDLFVFLGSKRQYANWLDEHILRFRLVEGVDFVKGIVNKSVKSPLVGRPAVDAFLTLRAAKEIAIMDKGPRGKELRLYFFDCEERVLQFGASAPSSASLDHDAGVRVLHAASRLTTGRIDQSSIPLAMEEFLATKGVSDLVARSVVGLHERPLAALLLRGDAPGRCGMHPASRRLVFDADALFF